MPDKKHPARGQAAFTLTELMVVPDQQGRGIGRQLIEVAWPGDPTPDLGRVVVAAGSPSDPRRNAEASPPGRA